MLVVAMLAAGYCLFLPRTLFDEPFSGFDPINANLLKDEILALCDKGATIIFSTHNMSSVEEICDHITLINKSRNILSGCVDDIRRRHGANIFEVAYRGDEAALRRAVEGRCEILEGSQDKSVYATLKLHVGRDEEVRAVIAAVNDEANLVEKEHKIDLIRWNEATELATFDYFDINSILSYLSRVNIVARWTQLDAVRGREMFERLMAELDGKGLIENKQ